MSNDSGNIFLALLTGAAIGVGIGILYSPAEGSKTRKKIKKQALETKHDWENRISHARAELTGTVNKKKVEFERNLENVLSDMSHKADDIIGGLEQKLEELRKKNAQFQK